MKNYYKVAVAVYLILRRDDEVLLLLRQNTGYWDGHYSLIAGHVEEGETASEAMIREAREEAGITLRPEDLTFACTLHRHSTGGARVDFFFEARRWSGDIVNAEPDKCGGLTFFRYGDWPENIISCVREALDANVAGVRYLEADWPEHG